MVYILVACIITVQNLTWSTKITDKQLGVSAKIISPVLLVHT